MKKLLLMALLVLALVVTVVACDKTPVAPEDTTESTTEASTEEAPTEEVTTAEDTTEEDTAEEDTAEEITTEEVTTEEVTTEEVTTEEVTTEEVTEPEAPASYDIDLTTVGITGSYPTVDVPTNGPALGLTPDDHVIVLHYGSIDLGEMDLSRYSKVTVTYATPTDTMAPGMLDQYNATAKRVLLLNAASSIQTGTVFENLPADEAIVATATYEMSVTNAAITTVEIDLSEIDYNGQLYLSFDFRNAINEFGATSYLIWVAGISFS